MYLIMNKLRQGDRERVSVEGAETELKHMQVYKETLRKVIQYMAEQRAAETQNPSIDWADAVYEDGRFECDRIE